MQNLHMHVPYKLLCTYQCYTPPPPTGDMWGFDLINMQISHVWGKSYEQIHLLLRVSNHNHLHFLTDLHSDITEMFILVLEN